MTSDNRLPAKASRVEVPGLTGLRFVAAFSVAVAHGTEMILRFDRPGISVTYWLPQIAGFGMSLFFVLSGFVIHYNYRIAVTEGGINGIGSFIWARFSRLYPLYFFILVLDVLLGQKLYKFMTGDDQAFLEVLRSLPYDLTLTQTWIYRAFSENSLIYVTGVDSGVTWSISTEWFFYLSYPFLAFFVIRARRPWIVGAAIIAWCAIWITLVIGIFEQEPAVNTWAVMRYGPLADLRGIQDSFFRWLMYFSPYLRIGEFMLGCLVSQLFVLLQNKTPTARERWIGQISLALCIVSIAMLTYRMYDSTPGRYVGYIRMLSYNFGLAPSIAVILFCSARYKTFISWFLDSRPIVALGEASYSMYLFHFLLFVVPASFIGGALPATTLNIVYSLSKFLFLLGAIMLVALGFHAYLEVPARQWLRKLWRDRSLQENRLAAYSIFAAPAVAALALLVAIPALSSALEPPVTHGVRIVLATYGANCGAHLGNATRAIGRICNGKDHCQYVVDVRSLGDPASGCAKDFAVNYQCAPGDERLNTHVAAEAGNGSRVNLSCRSDIEVKSATYGGNCGAPAGNVTADVQMTCDGAHKCSYTVDSERLGDPAPNCGKSFTVNYSCTLGHQARQIAIAGEAGFDKVAKLQCPGPEISSDPVTRPIAAAGPSSIRILAATYGGNCGAHIGNASADLKKACEGRQSCDYRVNVDTLRDPAPGCSKSYYVKYQCGETAPRTAFVRGEAGLGSMIRLSCH